ncbi:MAG: adenylyltransferase/cytidyltransferase family protein, partial [Patescibacteria group bacterium]
MTKVIVFGTFDIIHEGHLHLFKQAREYGDFLIVVVARDMVVCEVKGKSPQFDENTRLKNVMALNIADKVRLGCVEDRYQAIAEEKPDIVALGYDQRAFVDRLAEEIDEHVQIVRLAPYLPEIYKSSKLKQP